jgi:hypothetical protein
MFGYRKRQQFIIKMGIFSALLTSIYSTILIYLVSSIKKDTRRY